MKKPRISRKVSWADRFVRPVFGRPRLPAEGEMAKAVRKFRGRDGFCRFEGVKGNEGFGISLSFNPVTYQEGEDFIEVALRRATLRFAPSRGSGWSWATSLKEFVAKSVDAFVHRRLDQNAGTRAGEVASRTEVFVEGEAGGPLARLKGGGRQGVDARRQSSTTETHGLEVTATVTARYAQMTRSDTHFDLTLDSPAQDDLVRLNVDLDRIGVLSPDEPSAMNIDDVDVTLFMRAKDAGEHALRIRDAGGAWRSLVDHRNKAIVSEIYLSKFLKPSHQPLRLWPRRKT